MAVAEPLRVEVAYVGEAGGGRWVLEVPPGTTVRGAIERARVLERHPEIDLARQAVGIFGVRCGLDDLLGDGARVEIYRPLLRDPKEARRRRVAR
jgi:putative ubiquitin-RnfH superfamily antitoxin RatB of RatAB toxin-antitoxin module